MFKEDCFAFCKRNNGFKCRVLKDMNTCENCKTYKTWHDIYIEEETKIKPRLELLGIKFKTGIPYYIRKEFENEYKNNTINGIK